MSDFKLALLKDLATFINAKEFADVHTINGVVANAIIDTSAIQEATGDLQAIMSHQITIFLEQGTVPLPLKDEEFDLDGFRYICRAVRIEQGCDVIVAEQIISR